MTKGRLHKTRNTVAGFRDEGLRTEGSGVRGSRVSGFRDLSLGLNPKP